MHYPGVVLIDKAASNEHILFERDKEDDELDWHGFSRAFFSWLLFVFGRKEPKYLFSSLMGFKGF